MRPLDELPDDVRLIQATIPAAVHADAERVLDERGIDYFATEEVGTEEYAVVLYVSISEESVESVLDDLYAVGLDADDHVVLVDTEVDIFGRTDGATTKASGHARIAAAELEGKTEDLMPDLHTFVTMMVLSTVVATTGVLLDSPAVVVGSMVLAPLFGPAISASVGTVIDDSGMFWRGVRLQVLGVALAVAAAALFAWVVKTAYLLPAGFAISSAPQIVSRLSPDLLSLVVAFVAGVAGVVSIATASGRALVGVMMAAALLPPAAIVGVGFAWAEPAVALHSGLLLAVNLLAINFAGLVTLWYLGYRPKSWIQLPGTRRALLKRGGTLLVAILVTSAFLLNVTYASVQRSRTEDAIEEDLDELLSAPRYGNVTLLEVSVVQDRTSMALGDPTEKVIVSIGRPPGDSYPELYRRIEAHVEEQVGREITVDIRVSFQIQR